MKFLLLLLALASILKIGSSQRCKGHILPCNGDGKFCALVDDFPIELCIKRELVGPEHCYDQGVKLYGSEACIKQTCDRYLAGNKYIPVELVEFVETSYCNGCESDGKDRWKAMDGKRCAQYRRSRHDYKIRFYNCEYCEICDEQDKEEEKYKKGFANDDYEDDDDLYFRY